MKRFGPSKQVPALAQAAALALHQLPHAMSAAALNESSASSSTSQLRLCPCSAGQVMAPMQPMAPMSHTLPVPGHGAYGQAPAAQASYPYYDASACKGQPLAQHSSPPAAPQHSAAPATSQQPQSVFAQQWAHSAAPGLGHSSDHTAGQPAETSAPQQASSQPPQSVFAQQWAQQGAGAGANADADAATQQQQQRQPHQQAACKEEEAPSDYWRPPTAAAAGAAAVAAGASAGAAAAAAAGSDAANGAAPAGRVQPSAQQYGGFWQPPAAAAAQQSAPQAAPQPRSPSFSPQVPPRQVQCCSLHCQQLVCLSNDNTLRGSQSLEPMSPTLICRRHAGQHRVCRGAGRARERAPHHRARPCRRPARR